MIELDNRIDSAQLVICNDGGILQRIDWHNLQSIHIGKLDGGQVKLHLNNNLDTDDMSKITQAVQHNK